MSDCALLVDISNCKTNEDVIKIKFKDDDVLQVNFSNLVSQSKYIRDKYKYSEAIDSIQTEIEKVESELNISEEIIKLFIQLIQDGKVNISHKNYKDFYTLSEHFLIQKITTELDNIYQKYLLNDLNFSIQILLDSEQSNHNIEAKLASKIEMFLKDRINECIENPKFKELQISTIFRILKKSKENVNHDLLLDFILESAKNRFVLLKFVEIQKLREENIEKFIQFIDEQEENIKEMYLEYISFDFSLFKQMKSKYNKLYEEMNQTKEELKQNNEKINPEQTNEKMEFNSKHFNNSIIVCGRDSCNVLGEKPNNETKKFYPIIDPPINLSFDYSSLLSYSVYYDHLVLVTKEGSLIGIGKNKSGKISSTLPKANINQFTEFSIIDKNGQKLNPISAVCGYNETLYMLSKTGSKLRQLVLCHKNINKGDPVFLDIGNKNPVALFGSNSYFAAICSEGEIIFIDCNLVEKSPDSCIESVSLPDGEKASSVACYDPIFVLSSNGRVFESPKRGNNSLVFNEVEELKGKEIVCISGTCYHILAVSKDGHVFGRGSNRSGELGLGKEKDSYSLFTEISSLNKYKIRAAYAGNCHSLFETYEGKILSCGFNYFGQLLLTSGNSDEIVYFPTETVITGGATFCIAGLSMSAVFIGRSPPPNTPNMRILEYK